MSHPPSSPPDSRWRPGAALRTLALAAVALWGLGSVALGILVARANALRPHQPVTRLTSYLSPRAEAVRFPAIDGLMLDAYYAPPRPGRPVVVVAHGVGANRDDCLPYARLLAAAGYGVVSFDWRGHGRSQGDHVAFGAEETRDVEGVLGFLETRPEARAAPVGVLAISMGASCFAMAADRLPPRVRCLFLDSPYGSLPRMLGYRLSSLGPAGFLVGWTARAYSRLGLGVSLGSVEPEVALAAFAPRPVYVLHGGADQITPPVEGRRVFEAYPGPKRSWFTEGDAHTAARVVRFREYVTRLAGFLAETLPGAPSVAEVLAVTPASFDELVAGGARPVTG